MVSTTARGHVHAAGTRKDSSTRHPGEPADYGFGRSRGRWSTKIYIAVNPNCEVMSFLITPGQAGVGPQVVPVLEKIRVPAAGRGRPRPRPQRVLADSAYSSRVHRAWLRTRGFGRRSLSRRTRSLIAGAGGRPVDDSLPSMSHPTGVGTPCSGASTESSSNGGCATRFGKLAVHFEATVQLVVIRYWVKRLS